MKQIKVRKAEPIAESLPVEATEITIGGDTRPYEQRDLPRLRNQQAGEADRLEQALHDSLCGGTYHQLLVKMLQRKTSLLIVPQESVVPVTYDKDELDVVNAALFFYSRQGQVSKAEESVFHCAWHKTIQLQGGNDDSGT